MKVFIRSRWAIFLSILFSNVLGVKDQAPHLNHIVGDIKLLRNLHYRSVVIYFSSYRALFARSRKLGWLNGVL
jgi:hypothetical protein